MLGRAASLQAGRKENRWPAGGRGSRVRPHSGLNPDLSLSGFSLPSFSDPAKAHGTYWGKAVIILEKTGKLGKWASLGRGEAEGMGLLTMTRILDLRFN